MLTKKQLEDITKCGDIDCKRCDMQHICIVTQGEKTSKLIAKTAIAYRAMLERLEWRSFAGEHGFILNCPMCGGSRPDVAGRGHKSDCELAKLLKESEGEEG
jgi:hypothetical protein